MKKRLNFRLCDVCNSCENLLLHLAKQKKSAATGEDGKDSEVFFRQFWFRIIRYIDVGM